MSPAPIKLRLLPSRILVVAAMSLTVSVQADQTVGNDPFREKGKDPGFFHRASNDVGGFFKRLFGTDEEKQPPQQAQQAPSAKKRRSSGQRYNLDQPPAELRSTPASSPAAAKTPKDTAESNAKPKSPARTPSRGSTLTEEPPKSKPKTQKSTAPDSNPSVTSTETTTHAKSKKQTTDAASGSTGAGNVLYPNNATANTKQPEPPAKTRTETTPPPPKPHTEPPSVLTGSKTGKVGRVKSPYAPYSELDVTGLPSGSLALDPTTQKVFRIP